MPPYATLLIYYGLTAVQALLPGPGESRCLQGRTLDIYHFSKLSPRRHTARTGDRVAQGRIVLGARFVDSSSDDVEDSTEESWDNFLGESQDHDRWETIWREGEEEKQKASFLTGMADWGSGASGDVDVELAMPVEVVSFDLDDTLWSTKGVIDAANAALQEYLEREHPALVEKCMIPDLMKEIWKERMAADPNLDSSPVNLTELRKAGLARACEMTGADPSAVVEPSFDVWRKARHNVEPYLFPGVLETLRALQKRGIKLVAITNGNAQTDDIPCLKELFELCVMAEEVGERKPQSGPFREAAKRAGYPSEEYIGGEWVHVGDDWASDCVGAKTMRMRTILVRVPGKPRLGQLPEGEEDEEEEESGAVFDAEDGDDGYPVLKDESVSESGRVGAAWRVTEEKEKMSRRAEKLGLTIDGDFEVAAGVAGPNRERKKPSKRNETPSSQATGLGGREKTKKGVPGSSLDDKPEKYGKELAAIAMGDYSSLGGPGKLMSMGGSSYVMDMVNALGDRCRLLFLSDKDEMISRSVNPKSKVLMKDFMDVSLDNISEVLTTVDKWNAEYSAISASKTPADADADTRLSVAEEARQRIADEPRTASSVKFCIECGEKIPVTAKFCPMCGTKQVSISSA